MYINKSSLLQDTALNEICNVILEKSKNILILPHISADGDTLGSSLALALALNRINKNVCVYLEESIPRTYKFLPGIEFIKIYPEDDVFFENGQETDTVIAIDTGDIGRLGNRAYLLEKAIYTINIDHHPTNTEFCNYNYVSPDSSAVGEIIYMMLNIMQISLDLAISTCIYTAITTDTGGFRYSNTTNTTHLIVADLVKNGINVAEISSILFDQVSLEKVKLIGAALNTLELFENGQIAFLTITQKMLEETGAGYDDCDGIINWGRNIYGVKVAALFTQRKGEIKVGLRSNSDVDVSVIARSLNGGGHKKAAGCTLKGELDHIKETILNNIKQALNT